MNAVLPPVRRPEILALLLLTLAYAVPVVMCWNRGYLDFGDGNYMYISWRLSEGAVLYRDILAPQPPLHLYTGAAIAWIGDRLFSHPIWAFRTFSLVLHIATMLLVWTTARHLFFRESKRYQVITPLLAAGIFLVQPIGFWWTLGYQSQPLLIFLLLIMFHGVVRGTPRFAALGGLAGGLALLTNMTTAPYVMFTIGWMLLRRVRLGMIFTFIAILPPLLVIPLMEIYTGHYISNVFQNQVGAFPRADVMAQSGGTVAGYMLGKLRGEGADILRLQGTWVVLSIIGIIIYAARKRDGDILREYTAYYAFFSLLCVLYVTKGGTVDYVFSVAEPYVALFAAPVMASIITWLGRAWRGGPSTRDLLPILSPALAVLLFLSVTWPGMYFIHQTLRQRTYELTEPETMRLVNWIRQRTTPDDLIIAPPHLAFLAQRRIVEDYSEHFLWRLKYMNERLDGEVGQAVQTVQTIANTLNQKKLPFLVLDLNQTGILPEIEKAVAENYTPLLHEPLMTLNTPLQLYEPKP